MGKGILKHIHITRWPHTLLLSYLPTLHSHLKTQTLSDFGKICIATKWHYPNLEPDFLTPYPVLLLWQCHCLCGSACSLYKDRMHIYAQISRQLVFQLENKTFSVITKIVTKNQVWNLDILVKSVWWLERISEKWDQPPLKNQLYPHIYSHLILDKSAKNIHWRKDSLFIKWCWGKWTSMYKTETRILFITPWKINSNGS